MGWAVKGAEAVAWSWATWLGLVAPAPSELSVWPEPTHVLQLTSTRRDRSLWSDAERSVGGMEGCFGEVWDPPVQRRPWASTAGWLGTRGDELLLIAADVERFVGQLDYCYASAGLPAEQVTDVLEVRWVLDGGPPEQVEVVGGAPAARTCVSQKVRRWGVRASEPTRVVLRVQMEAGDGG
jgi:hypothetical protein